MKDNPPFPGTRPIDQRQAILNEVQSITPFDEDERRHRADVMTWIGSGAELCRRQKPATPPKHLVSYFVLTDSDSVLLVDHKNARLWLPTGGHVEPEEHPRTTVVREAKEELEIQAEFMQDQPLFLTCAMTVGLTAGHTDVSLWYLLRGDRRQDLSFDRKEFNEVRWFGFDEVPHERSDPHMGRFLAKLREAKASSTPLSKYQ